jgi:monoamine oxidase
MMFDHSFSSENKLKIVIVGAGLSGLTAAYRLQQQGYDIHVYEARHRPGGRVLSIKIGDSYEELGGRSFKDGGDPIHSLKLINELNLEILQSEKPFSRAYANNDKITPYLDLLRKFKSPKDLRGAIAEIASRSQNLQDVINILFKDDLELRILFSQIMTFYEGSDPETLGPNCVDSLYELFSHSYKGLKEEDEGKIVTMTWLLLKKGNAQLPLTLSEKLNTKIHYGSVLKSIHRNQEKIVLTFSKDLEVTADIVLLTIPCPVFQDIKFGQETIPQEQINHILNVQYGTNSKILVPVMLKKKKYEIVFTQNFISWLNDDDRIMTLYSGGSEGIFDQEGAKSLLNQAETIFKKCYKDGKIESSTLSHGEDRQFVSYPGAVFKSWVKDPYAKGSYSNRGVDRAAHFNEVISIRGEEVRTLFRPVQEQIFFAGEHTTTLSILGTMESAIESGERMARLIGKSIQEVRNASLRSEAG